MVGAVGVPIVDYTLAVKNQDRFLAQFQKTPSYAQSVAYYQANIGKVTSADALLNDRKLLTVALSAFQLESQVDAKGILTKLLTQDPNASGSLAQQLLDPRYKQFAQAFAGLRSDGGASVNDPNNINAVLAGFQRNEYGKWLANNTGDTTVRQALFFQQTIQDTVDISNTGKLFTQFQQSQGVQQAVAAYTSGIAQVTSVDALLDNKQVLNVALGAFNIDPTSVTPDTLRRLLTEPTTSPLANPSAPSLATDPLAADRRLAQFALAFNSLNTDGGATVQGSSSINSIIAGYQTNQFTQTLAVNDPSTVVVALGSTAGSSINTLLSDFQTKSGIAQSTTYYQNTIGGVNSVDGLVNDPRLLSVALGAFNIDPATVSSAVVRQLLTDDPNGSPDIQAQATALLQNDPNAAKFVTAFGALSPHDGAGFADTGNLLKQFQQLASVQNAVSYFQNNIGKAKSVADLTGNSQLLSVALTAFGLDPAAVSSSTVNRILTETPAQQAQDALLTTDSRFAQFAQAFASLNTTDQGAELKAQGSVDAIVAAYQTNLFARTVATNNPATTAADFADGSTTINRLQANFAASSGTSQPIAYYQSHIDNVTSVSDLVGDPQLLKVALGAFNLDRANLSPQVVTQLLTNDPTTPANLTQNPDVANFVAAFASLNTDNGVQAHKPASIAAITAAFQSNQFKQSIEAKAQAIVANPSLASTPLPLGDSSSIAAVTTAFSANRFRQSVASQLQSVTTTPSTGTLSTVQLLGNATLAAVTYGALGLPTAIGGLPVDQQLTALKNANFDPTKLLDSNFLSNFVNQFLANAGLQQSSADPITAIFQPLSSSDNIPDPTVPPTGVDLSFLNGNSSGGSVLDLFA